MMILPTLPTLPTLKKRVIDSEGHSVELDELDTIKKAFTFILYILVTKQ